MRLSTIFQQLALGELNQLGILEEDGITVRPDKYPLLISQINLALTVLFTRFPLIEKIVTIRQIDSVTDYSLTLAHADTATGTELKYIVDTAEIPFTEDIIHLFGAYDELGAEVPLNDLEDETSWYTPSYNTVQIPTPVSGNFSLFTYRASHPVLDVTLLNPEAVEVYLPDILLPALLAYIASRIHATRTEELSVAVSARYLSQYNGFCTEIENSNVLNTSTSQSNNKLGINGWL